MAFIAPLRGVYYNREKAGSLDDVVTPPYDVIQDSSIDSYITRNPYSMIQLDITKNPGGAVGPDSRYQAVADLFHSWLDDDILLRDSSPALYLYKIQYKHPSGKMLTRKGFVAQVGLSEFGEGVVKPHEETFASVIQDRLRLLDTTKAQFSQIFSLYSDRKNTVLSLLEKNCEDECMGSVTDGDGCIHSLYRVSDGAVILQVQKFFMDKSLYIADGHHRYTTALAYRELMRKRKEDFSDKDPANHIMMYLCPMEDPGLSVLPTHRLLNRPGILSMDALVERLKPLFELDEITGGSREVLLAEVLSRMDEMENHTSGKRSTSFGVYHPGEDRCFLLVMKTKARELLADKPAQLRGLDVVILSDIIIHHALDLSHEQCEAENLINYFSDPDEAMDAAVKKSNNTSAETPLLFVMNPTLVEQVKEVADEKIIMPHKSTYFYPKIMTGLLFNQQREDEEVDRLA